MNIVADITSMESRLKAGGQSVDALCEAAGIARSTWTRWKAEDVAPNMQTWTRALGAFDEMTKGNEAAE